MSVVLGLFSGRWILQALGEVDYGLLGVVGGLIGFVTVLNGIVSGTCSRFFALSIGKRDVKDTQLWFNTALIIHVVLPTFLIIIGWPIGEWTILNYCNIPVDRLVTARWVFRLSLLSSFVSMMTAPYMGMLIAKQRIAEVSMWSVGQTVTNFVFVYCLLGFHGDVWLLYAIGQVGMSIFFMLVQSYRAKKLYVECQFDKTMCFKFENYKKIFLFASWQLFGGLTGIFRGNLIAILINKHFPPVSYPAANASMQIGGTISSYTQTIATALNGALSPEITSTEGRGDRVRMLTLSDKASKFSSFLVLLFAVPIGIEIKEILTLWLVNPPEYAWYFALMYLLCLFVDNLTIGYMIAINAVGKIGKYQATVGGVLLFAYPLAWIFVALWGFPYISVGWALAITTAMASVLRVWWAKKLICADVSVWCGKVFIPCVIVLIVAVLVGCGVKVVFPVEGLVKSFITLVITFFTIGLVGSILILDTNDRRFIGSQIEVLKQKVIRK